MPLPGHHPRHSSPWRDKGGLAEWGAWVTTPVYRGLGDTHPISSLPYGASVAHKPRYERVST